MTDYIERVKRDRNLYKLKKEMAEKKLDKVKQENEYLKKRDKILTAFEKSLPQRIEKYKKNNAPVPVIQELEYINNMLILEKERINNEEQEEE